MTNFSAKIISIFTIITLSVNMSTATTPEIIEGLELSIMPSEHTIDEKPLPYICTFDTIYGFKFTVFNKDFQVIKTFNEIAGVPISFRTKPKPGDEYASGEERWSGMLTQSFFTDDTSFNFCIPILTPDLDSDLENSYNITGIKVMSDNNDVVSNIIFPMGYHIKYSSGYRSNQDFSLMILDGIKYLIIGTDGKMNPIGSDFNETPYLIYKIDGTSSSIDEPVAIINSTNVSPKIVHQGEAVKVSFGENTSAYDAYITVVDINGREFSHQNIPAGESNAVIDTAEMPKGMYIISVDNKGKQKNHTKFLVK